jgi:hypothetical protein
MRTINLNHFDGCIREYKIADENALSRQLIGLRGWLGRTDQIDRPDKSIAQVDNMISSE